MKIVFQNENLIAVDKDPLVLTTPARFADDPRPCLGRDLQKFVGRQIYPVHRLDFEVSGLVLFALDADAHRIAQRWFEVASVGKLYHAVASRPAAPSEWTEWRSRLVRGKRRTFEAPHGQPAHTRARSLDGEAWELQPVTGRPHQLRVEMAKRVAPILGDVLYGAPARPEPGIALRAVALDFAGVGDRLGLPETLEVTR